MSLRSGKLPFLGSEDEFFTIRDIVPSVSFWGRAEYLRTAGREALRALGKIEAGRSRKGCEGDEVERRYQNLKRGNECLE
jgi:hypothetical protein